MEKEITYHIYDKEYEYRIIYVRDNIVSRIKEIEHDIYNISPEV